jgi:hypothetical protein
MAVDRKLNVGASIPGGSLVGRLFGGDGPALVVPVSDVVNAVAASGKVLTPGTAPLTVVAAGTGIGVSHSSLTYTVSTTLTAPAAGFTATAVAGGYTFALANDLAALEALAGTGIAVRTTTDTWAQRSLTAPAAGITISNNDGVAGNPTFALANDLSALEGLAGTGIAVRTTTDTWAQRTITGTAGKITVTNGDGVAGNPTLTIDVAYVGQTSITTLGTIGTGTWNAGIITGQFGGTGVANTGFTITLGGSVSTAAALTQAGAFATTLTSTAISNATLPAGTHTLAGLDVAQVWTAAQTYTNSDLKLLGSSTGATTFSSANAGVSNFTITVPAITGTLITTADTGTVSNTMLASSSMTLAGHVVSLGGTQTFAASDLTNGTTGSGAIVLATAPAIAGGTISGLTAFALRDTSAAFDLTLAATSSVALTAGRTLTIDAANVAHTLALGTTANTITFPNAASYTVAGLSVAGTWSATQTSMTLATATLTGVTTLPGNGIIGSGGNIELGFNAIVNSILDSPNFQMVGTGAAGSAVAKFEASTNPAYYLLEKSRGTTSTAGAVASGDNVGSLSLLADDGSTNGKITVRGALMQWVVDATVSTGVVPMRCELWTMNAAGTLGKRMRLNSSGGLGIGTDTDPGAGNLLVSGTVQANTAGSNFVDLVHKDIYVSTAQLDKNLNTTIATITGLTTATLTTGKTYLIRGHLSVSSGASGGIKVQLTAAGGLTLTSASITMFAYAGTTLSANTTTTAIGASGVAVTAAITDVIIEGVIVVNVAGTLSVQMAQNVSNGTTTSVLVNSYFKCERAVA